MTGPPNARNSTRVGILFPASLKVFRLYAKDVLVKRTSKPAGF